MYTAPNCSRLADANKKVKGYKDVKLQSAITFILRSFSDSGSEWVIMRAPSPAAAASEAPVTKGIWFNTSMELNR